MGSVEVKSKVKGRKALGKKQRGGVGMCEMRTRESHRGKMVKGSKIMSHLLSAIWTIIYPRQWQMVPKKQLRMSKQKKKKKSRKNTRAAKFEPTAIFCHEAPNMCAQQQHSPLCAPDICHVCKSYRAHRRIKWKAVVLWGGTPVVQVRNEKKNKIKQKTCKLSLGGVGDEGAAQC